MEIFVVYKVENAKYQLDVKSNDKVIDVKTELKQQTGLFIKEQKLFYNNIELKNDEKIQNYSIPNGATLNLIKKKEFYSQISIKPPIGRSNEIEVSNSTTIKEIKDEIFKLRGISQNQQKIIAHDKVLSDDSNALKEIYQYGTAKLEYKRENTKKILIKPPNDDYVQLLVDENDTIKDIKYEVGTKIGHYLYDDNSSALMFCGIKLENDRKIKDYMLPKNAILDYLICLKKNGQIVYIKNGYGQFIPLEVTPKDKVISIKEQIEKLEGILVSQQDLFFEGQPLLDQKEIQFYRIYPFSVIDLKRSNDSQSPDKIQISFKLPSIEEPFQVEVDPKIQVKKLKELIESIIGLKSSDQKLVFQCRQLEDDFSLHYYSITKNSMIIVTPFEKKQIRITVNIPNGKPLEFDAYVTDFVKELKLKINTKTGYPLDKQVLIKKFVFLNKNEDDSLQSLSITSDTTIDLYLIERGGFYIQVKVSHDKYIPFELMPDDTLLDIKNELLKREGIPLNKRTLFFNKPDNTKISELNLSKYETLKYTPCKQGAVQMFVKNLSGAHLTFCFRTDERVSEVKRIISLMEGVPVKDMRLIYSGRQIEDENTLNDYKIQKDSTIHMVLRLRG